MQEHMTQKEAECYLATKKWQREFLRRQMSSMFVPRFPFAAAFRSGKIFGKALIILVNIFILPFTILWWCFRFLKGIFFYPLAILFSHAKPKNLRGPGERNIKGIHYQFASHIELPTSMYIACVNEWTGLLYGADKLPKYRFENYLSADYLQRKKTVADDDALLEQILKAQISNAREELSRDLGHY